MNYGYGTGAAGLVTNRSTANEQVRAYRRSVAETVATSQATEHSYQIALKVLVEGFSGSAVRAVNEPSHVLGKRRSRLEIFHEIYLLDPQGNAERKETHS